ncbi:MAG: serine/threonine protein kinase [Deltaproteobacteria bacterium]|nr:MAG: serine/threonine protein kinase [Deltaproteobacteria bacterium]
MLRFMADSSQSPLWSALESSSAELERMIARADQLVSGLCIAVALYASAAISPSLGLPLSLLSGLAFAYFSVAAAMLSRGLGFAVLRWVNPLVELALPGAALLITVFAEGPAYALGSWVPPMLFTLYIGAGIVRLHAPIPFAVGVLAAAEYLFVWLVAIRGAVDPTVTLFSPRVQLVRASSLVLFGIGSSLAVVALRRVIDAANADVRSQELFGKYRLLDEIASGGMGRVIRAVYCPEGGFERPVAVKLIHPHLAADPAFVERFRTEAELAARLAHPNIASALDFGRVDDTFFLALEYVDGPTLGDLNKHRYELGTALSLGMVAFIGQQLASGLQYAHELALDPDGQPLRVVHRDLSPSNVLLARNGTVKITDFGVARALGTEHSAKTHTLAGKPSYVAPEQLKDGVIDQRVDLWALGVLLWELAANRRLFARREEAATLYAVVEAPIPPISSLRADAGPAWDAFFERILCREPDGRFASAAEVDEALHALVDRDAVATAADLAAVVRRVGDVQELELDPTRVG